MRGLHPAAHGEQLWLAAPVVSTYGGGSTRDSTSEVPMSAGLGEAFQSEEPLACADQHQHAHRPPPTAHLHPIS